MKKYKRINNTMFDAGGSLVLLFIFGVPALIIVLVVGLIVLTVKLIRTARKKNDDEG